MFKVITESHKTWWKLFGKTIYFKNETPFEIRNRFLFYRWTIQKQNNLSETREDQTTNVRKSSIKINEPDVSIIVPVFNAQNYIEACIRSLIEQNNTNLEFIFINDNSQDESLNKIKSIQDNRIKIIDCKINIGVAAARNIGLAIAKGKYIGFVDPDDVIDKDYFGHLYRKARINNADIVMTNSIVKMSDSGQIIGSKSSGNNSEERNLNSRDRMRIALTTGVSWNKIYRKELLLKNMIQFPEIKTMGTDNYFTALSLILANKVITTNKVSYFYRENPNSIIRKKKDESYFLQVEVYQRLLERVKHLSIKRSLKIEWEKVINYRATNDFYNNIKGFDTDEQKRAFIDFINSKYNRFKIEPLKEPIVSLTSYPARIRLIKETISSLKNQSVQIKKIVLYLAESQFPQKEKDLPESLLNLVDEQFCIEWTKEDIRSYKKLLPALQQFPDEIIITADDDVIYPQDWAERLLKSYAVDKDCIHCLRGRDIKVNNREIEPYSRWRLIKQPLFPSYKILPTGVGGCLYTKALLDQEIFDKDKYMSLAKDADDIWFWSMALKKGTKIKIAHPSLTKPKIIEGTQDTALWNDNVTRNDSVIKSILNSYPEVKEKII